MSLLQPKFIHLAGSNVEAAIIKNALSNAGIEAHVVEDVSQVGTWSMGLVSQIHKPQIWVEKEQAAAAIKLVQEVEDSRRTQAAAEAGTLDPRPYCYFCGEPIADGLIACPTCGHTMEPELPENAVTAVSQRRPQGTPVGTPPDQSLFSRAAKWKRPLILYYLAAHLLLFAALWLLERYFAYAISM